MATETIKAGYVITDCGSIYVQVPSDNQWGFSIDDDDQSFPGGFDLGSDWNLLADDDPRITAADRERLGWILEATHAHG